MLVNGSVIAQILDRGFVRDAVLPMAQWYYIIDDRELGPCESRELKCLAESGQLKPAHRVRRAEMSDWYLASRVKGLFGESESRSAAVGALPAPSTDADKQSSADQPSDAKKVATPAISEQVKVFAHLACINFAVWATKLMRLFPADVRTGRKAANSHYERDQFVNLFRAIENLDREIEKIRETGSNIPYGTAVERVRWLGKLITQMIHLLFILQGRHKLLAKLGSAIRTSPDHDADNTLKAEIADAKRIAAKVTALETTGAKLATCQIRLTLFKKTTVVVVSAGILLSVTWIAKCVTRIPATDRLQATAAEPGAKASASEERIRLPASSRSTELFWLMDFIKTTSQRYSKLGYGNFRFGATIEEVRKNPTLDGDLLAVDHGGLYGVLRDGTNQNFFFDDGRLRVISKEYEGDIGTYVGELTGLFGKALPEDVFKTVGRDADGNVFSQIDAYYFCPETISRVAAFTGASPFSHSGPTELVAVDVFDKKWLLPHVKDHGRKVGTALAWINANVRPGQVPTVSSLPSFPDATRTFSPQGEQNENKWHPLGDISELVSYDTNQTVFLFVERFEHDGNSPSIPESGSLRVSLVCGQLPGVGDQIISCSALQHLFGRLLARLAQSYFPVKGGEIYRDHNEETGIEFYRWKSVQGWTVEVGPNWISLIDRRVKL